MIGYNEIESSDYENRSIDGRVETADKDVEEKRRKRASEREMEREKERERYGKTYRNLPNAQGSTRRFRRQWPYITGWLIMMYSVRSSSCWSWLLWNTEGEIRVERNVKVDYQRNYEYSYRHLFMHWFFILFFVFFLFCCYFFCFLLFFFVVSFVWVYVCACVGTDPVWPPFRSSRDTTSGVIMEDNNPGHIGEMISFSTKRWGAFSVKYLLHTWTQWRLQTYFLILSLLRKFAFPV